ncbi:MAG: prepilin-type N-terminal cleavage/methylation protein [Bacillales bacterium]|jgi:prepilin-type N-terminal cleavage/methylation domain-containing protein|nr:prepilin-type N-terminal cleavage/methylation protein [Bacillales bacterium]
MRKLLRNQNGVSLVEILAALTILGIIFVSFLSFFPQASKSSNKTGEMLTAVNLAKEKLVTIQNDNNIKSLLKTNSPSSSILSRVNYPNLKLSQDITTSSTQYELLSIDNTYDIKIVIDKSSQSFGSLQVNDQLFKVYILLNNKKGEKVSDLFGYITVKGES